MIKLTHVNRVIDLQNAGTFTNFFKYDQIIYVINMTKEHSYRKVNLPRLNRIKNRMFNKLFSLYNYELLHLITDSCWICNLTEASGNHGQPYCTDQEPLQFYTRVTYKPYNSSYS